MTLTAPISTGPSRRTGLIHAAIAFAVVTATSLAGNAVTIPSLGGWYAALAKPWFNPPNWVFGPAWTTLFILMGIAFWRVLQTPAGTPGRRAAIAAFLAQLLLNFGWSLVFFGLQSPGGAIVEIVPFWLMIAATIALFARVDRLAAWLLAPYLAWVTFATVLNVAIWRLN